MWQFYCSRTFLASLLFSRIVFGDAGPSEQSLLTPYSCQDPAYSVHLFSKSPLVVYISNFITPGERAHLQEVSKGTFSDSATADGTGSEGLRKTRTSQSTTVPQDEVVRCIEDRALHFQGFDTPRTHLEPLQLVQYFKGQNYHFHTDWFSAASQTTSEVGGNRLTSFFVYVEAGNVTGGGTNFPILDAPKDDRWCEFVDCDESFDNGVTFKPLPGNGIFWQNLMEDGNGDPATLHAGLPVTHGKKLGMNIWTRQGPLGKQFRDHS